MKILQLVLYSRDPVFDAMTSVSREWYEQCGIETLYYCFEPSLSAPYERRGDLLCIRGRESYRPGVLLKTLTAMAYALEIPFDYLVRSNASTLVHFPRLLPKLPDPAQIVYAGAINTLRWLDPAGGVVDERHWGTRYVSGTCIILSRPAVEYLLQRDIDASLIDDLAIGVAMRGVAPTPIGTMHVLGDDTTAVFFRHRTPNRRDDVEAMRQRVALMRAGL
jgi:hypothetical protein